MTTDKLVLSLIDSIAEEERLADFHRQKHDFHRSRAEQLRVLVSRFEHNEVNETVSEQSTTTLLGGRRMGPSKAIQELFRSKPDKAWTPLQLLEALNMMKRMGQLDTEAAELLPSIHTIIKRLLTKGRIEPAHSNGDKAYKHK